MNALAPVQKSGQAKTAFFTTGAEAVENAVRSCSRPYRDALA
ncbi:hypothetical protein ACLBR5_19020 [Escherichia coli]